MSYIDLEFLKGKTLSKVEGDREGSDEIILSFTDGTSYAMNHQQDCCESVQVEEIIGSMQGLIGEPLLVAEESSREVDDSDDDWNDLQMWTFYKFATVNDHCTVRWRGASNGYYSVGVDIYEITGGKGRW
jgi:hypothetical protein